jgi:thioredoxin reductase
MRSTSRATLEDDQTERRENHMKFSIRITAAVTIAMAIAPSALACKGLESESRTFFASPPPTAESKSVVAEVEVVSTSNDGSVRLTETVVVTGIKGAKPGAKLTIQSERHSCAHDPEIKPGKRFFVAGDINTGGILRGSWRFKDWPKSDKPGGLTPE